MEFEIVQGDITKQRADALVNAANTDIKMGGGVAGALREAAGEDLQREANKRSPISLGDAVETGAYDLAAEYVIHAATMELGGGANESTIRNSTRSALVRADELSCESMVLPALGCGIAGVDLDDGAYYIFEEIADFDSETLTDIRVIGYRDESFQTMKRIADEMREEHDGPDAMNDYWEDKEWEDTMWRDSVLQFGLPVFIRSDDGVITETEVLLGDEVMRIDDEITVEVGDTVEYKDDGQTFRIEEELSRPDSGYTAYKVSSV